MGRGPPLFSRARYDIAWAAPVNRSAVGRPRLRVKTGNGVKTFERVLFLAAFLFVDIYTTRHIYQLWLAPTSSVLDEFRAEVETSISSAASIRELIAKYRPARDAVRKLEEQNRGKSPEQWRFEDQEPFKTETTLRQAIEEWEQKQHDLFETRVYWAFGLITAILGLLIHRKVSRWLGLAFLITGFSEMVWWCSPSWFTRATAETERLLANKLALAVATMLLLVGGARLLGLIADEAPRGEPTSVP